MRRILIFVVALLIGASIMILYVRKTVYQNQTPTINKSTKQKPLAFSLEDAPTESLKGIVTLSNGIINWESRVASTESVLDITQPIQQGEYIRTNNTSQIAITFSDVATVSARENTQLEFTQTLPSSIVINQPKGTAEYTTSGLSPLSVRTLHLLTQQTKGDTVIAINDELPLITIHPLTIAVQVAFNDTDNISTVLTIPLGKTLTFNDDTRKASIR